MEEINQLARRALDAFQGARLLISSEIQALVMELENLAPSEFEAIEEIESRIEEVEITRNRVDLMLSHLEDDWEIS